MASNSLFEVALQTIDRTLRRALLIPATITLLLLPTVSQACIMTYRPAEELQREAESVIVATLVSEAVINRTAVGEEYVYRVRIERVERGGAIAGETTITYFNLRAHERDGVIHCFAMNGSGLETKLVANQRYRFFLRSVEDKELLFSEVVSGR